MRVRKRGGEGRGEEWQGWRRERGGVGEGEGEGKKGKRDREEEGAIHCTL